VRRVLDYVIGTKEETTNGNLNSYYIDENLRLERKEKKKEARVLPTRYLYTLVHSLSSRNISEYILLLLLLYLTPFEP
jgi:hypothetical protein